MSEDNKSPKEGEVLPPEEKPEKKNEDGIIEALKGFADAFVRSEEEKTKRLEMRLKAEREWTPQDDLTRMVIIAALVSVGAAFYFAFQNRDSCLVSSILTGFFSFLGGFGFGKTSKRPANEESEP